MSYTREKVLAEHLEYAQERLGAAELASLQLTVSDHPGWIKAVEIQRDVARQLYRETYAAWAHYHVFGV